MFRISQIAYLNVCCFFLLGVSVAQSSNQTARVTEADHARAEKFMPYNTTPLVFGTVRPSWLKDDRFWFRNAPADGSEFVVVDGATGKPSSLFEQSKLAAALSSASKAAYEGKHLPFEQVEVSADEQTVEFNLKGRRWKCDVLGTQCTAEGGRDREGEEPALPRCRERRRSVWMFHRLTASSRRLFAIGTFGFATSPAARRHNSPPTA